MRKQTLLLLFHIVALAAMLRLWQLGHVPVSPDWDEVALGYDAYSIIHTGRDEFGKFLPVVLRSFDDYKPALYAYLAVPFVYVLGLSVYAVRLPSAIFGVLAVVATFFLAKELFRRQSIALTAAFLMAISPWSIQFSRVGFESNVGDALNIFAALFFVKGLKKPWLLLLTALFAGLSIYVYQSEKVFTPLLLLLLMAVYYKDLLRLPKKYLAVSAGALFLVVLPMLLYIITNHNALLRVQGTLAFSNPLQILQSDTKRLEIDKAHHDILGLVLDNRRIIYSKVILQGYLSHFNLNWLFISGDIARHHAPQMGLFYLWELPFIVFGCYSLLFGDFDKKTKLLIFGWLLLAPVPASITSGVPHAVRTLNFLPMWQLLTAVGIVTSIAYATRIHSKNIRYFIITLPILFFIFNFSYYLDQYFVQLNYYDSAEWQYGYDALIPYVQNIKGNYRKVIVSDNQPLDKSYMFFLFYLQYPPQLYQNTMQNDSGGFASHHSFDVYEFRPLVWQKDLLMKNVLLIGTPHEFPGAIHPLKMIYNPDGTPAIEIVGT